MSNNFATTKTMLANGLFLKIERDDWYFSSLADYDESAANRFSRHPEESRLQFTEHTSSYGNSYYADALNVINNIGNGDVEDSLATDFKKAWERVLDENKGCTDLIELDFNFYKSKTDKILNYLKGSLNAINNILKDIHQAGSWDKYVEESDDQLLITDLENLFTDYLVGYRFNQFSDKDWEVDGEFDIHKGLVKIYDFLTQNIEIIEKCESIETLLNELNNSIEFMEYVFENCGSAWETNFNYTVEREFSIIYEFMKSLYFKNPNVHLISLYEHSGICLQKTSTCAWDSTNNAALIIGNDQTFESVYNEVNNILQNNIWYAKQYQLITAEDEKFYFGQTVQEIDFDIDSHILEQLGLSKDEDLSDYRVIVLDDCGGFVCDYDEWSDILNHFASNGVQKNTYSVEVSTSYKAEITKGKVVMGITKDNYADLVKEVEKVIKNSWI